jgi:hypothetical protein
MKCIQTHIQVLDYKGGGRPPPPPPNLHKNHSLKKVKSVEKLGREVHVTCTKLKLIKYVSTEETDDILEEIDV